MAMIRPETEMKDSGIEYLGEMPIAWGKCRLKNVCTSFNSNITTAIINKEHGNYKIFGASGLIGYIEFETMQDEYLGIVKDGAGVGRIGSYPSHSSLLGTLAYIIPNDGINMNWLKYVIENMNLGESIDKTTIPHIYFSTYGNDYIPFPSPDEQQAIADYLDETCSKIDEIIAEAKASIDEYKELKQSVIFEAVTKGLDKNVEMKEAEEKWLHNIPNHWRMERGKNLLYETNLRSVDGQEELLTVSQYTGVTPRSKKNVTMFQAESLVDYKICEVGDIAANTMWMWAGAVGVSNYHGVISPSYNTYRQKHNDYNSDYLDYLLRIKPLVDEYASLSTGIRASRLRLYPTQFLSINYPVPPLGEQMDIVDFLDKRTTDIDSLITEKESLINDLEAYKKSLIYEVVTGKRRVV
jgi:type I restriction enzyme S subunit